MTGQELCDLIKKNDLLDADLNATCCEFADALCFKKKDCKVIVIDQSTGDVKFLKEHEDDYYDCEIY